MSAWRRKASELFPDLRREVEAPDATIYTLFFALLPRCRRAHREGDEAELARIYGFAEWCATQPAKDLWNAAGVAFYEHLADDEAILDELPRRVGRAVFEDVAGLLEARVGVERVAALRRRYGSEAAPPTGTPIARPAGSSTLTEPSPTQSRGGKRS